MTWQARLGKVAEIAVPVCNEARWCAAVRWGARPVDVMKVQPPAQEQDPVRTLPYLREEIVGLSAREYERNGVAVIGAARQPFAHFSTVWRVTPDAAIPLAR